MAVCHATHFSRFYLSLHFLVFTYNYKPGDHIQGADINEVAPNKLELDFDFKLSRLSFPRYSQRARAGTELQLPAHNHHNLAVERSSFIISE